MCCCLTIILVLVFALKPSQLPWQTITVDGVERQYIVYIPPALDTSSSPSQSVSVLFGLHGGSGNAQQYARSNGFMQVADKYNIIAIFPNGLPCGKGIISALRCWNSGTIFTNPQVNDISFLKAILSDILTKGGVKNSAGKLITVNASKVFITGHSNGALMTYRTIGEEAGLFAAAAPVSGAIGGQVDRSSPQFIINKPSVAVSVIHVHGLVDDNVPMNSTEPHAGLLPNSIYIPTLSAINFFLNADNCTPNSVTSLSQGTQYMSATPKEATITVYNTGGNSCSQQTNVVSLLLNAGHMWSDMNSVITKSPIKTFAEVANSESLAETVWLLMQKFAKV